MTVNELYFRAPGWRFYAQGITVSALGLVLLAWGAAGLAFDSLDWVGAIPLLGGVLMVVTGAGLILLVLFIFVYGMLAAWRDWRQLRPPAVVINAAGARFEAPRRPALIPWPDIEEVHLKRTIFPKRVVTKVSLRLTSGAASLRHGLVNVSPTRYLNVGLMSDLDVPEDIAVDYLADVAGTRLQIMETVHRTAAAANSGR